MAETERIRQEGLDAAAQAAASVAAGGAAAVAAKEKAQEKGTAEEKIPGGKIVAGLPKASALVAGSDPASCTAKSGTVAETNWCKTGCTNEPPNCPAEVCECEGGAPGGPAALVPSPAPVLATDIEERPKTKAEKQAEAAVAARDALSAAADQKRIDDEASRVTEEEARVAALTPKDTLGEVKGEDEEVPELTQQGQPVVTEEGTAKARALSDSEVATQKALDERDAQLAKQDEARDEQEKLKLEEQEKNRLVTESKQRSDEQEQQPSPSPDAATQQDEEGPAEQ